MEQYDIVIVGYGGAAAAAALTARTLGATVLVLEKSAEAGGSTAVSAGNLRMISDPDGAIEHFYHASEGMTPRSVIRTYVEGMLRLPKWIERLGGRLVRYDQNWSGPLMSARAGSAFPHLPRSDAIGSRMQIERGVGVSGGEAMWELMRSAVERVAPTILTGARAIGLRRRAEGMVCEVRYEIGGQTEYVGAKQGVILACGGFSWDANLQIDLFGVALPSFSPPWRNTGDGIRLAQAVGAATWHMTSIAAGYGYKFPEYEAAFACTPPSAGCFLVDQTGRRYIDEFAADMHAAGLVSLSLDAISGRMLRFPSWLIFDERTRLSGPIAGVANGYNRGYKWSEDNGEELERGWITSALGIRELAERIDVDTGNLSACLDSYNRSAGDDFDQFGRRGSQIRPLEGRRLYAVQVWPSLLNTQGGPRRNAACQVISADHEPIPGLYAAGELGSMWTRLYPGAGNLGEALVSGQVAIESALDAVAY